MPRKKKPITSPDLAPWLRDELAARNLALTDLEGATGIPDATLSRIFSGEVRDPKASQLARIAIAMKIPVHVAMARAGFTDDAAADATTELQLIAAIISDKPDLQSILTKLIGLSPSDVRAVRKYIELLRSD